MVNNDPTKASTSSDAKANSAASVPPLDPTSPIEVASGGTGTVDDPVAKDIKPPGVYGEDLSLLA